MKYPPLPKKITREIRLILEGCQSGYLRHTQAMFHCGTSHCIAGWKEMLDAGKLTGLALPDLRGKKLDEIPLRGDLTGGLTLNYTAKQWRLTPLESDLLFFAHAQFPEQFTVLEVLEAGLRIDKTKTLWTVRYSPPSKEAFPYTLPIDIKNKRLITLLEGKGWKQVKQCLIY